MMARRAFGRISEAVGSEFRPLLQLATPVVIAELGWMAMSITDVILVGRVGPAAMGAVSIGSSLFFTVAIFGMGLLLGLDYVVAQAYGAGKPAECHRALLHALCMSAVLAVPLLALLHLGVPALRRWGLDPDVERQAIPFLRVLTWSLLPLLLFSCVRRYLQALGIVRPTMVVLLLANLVNIVAGWALIFGHLGAPALGATGTAWATCISRTFMALSVSAYALFSPMTRALGLWRIPLRVDVSEMWRLFRVGLPASLQTTLEVGVFATATALAGRCDAVSLAAHQVALTVAGFTFMVPLGVSAAAAVRVGQALGRRNGAAAARAGWAALAVGALFMSGAGTIFMLMPRLILRVFTTDGAVITIGASLLFIAALFQLFDGVQVVATGALRGTGDTRTPMLCNLLGHWLLGLPVGYTLAFVVGWGVFGLWVGLCVGLIAVALVLLRVWSWRVDALSAA